MYAVSSSTRCCGSIASASADDTRNAALSKRSAPIRKPPCSAHAVCDALSAATCLASGDSARRLLRVIELDRRRDHRRRSAARGAPSPRRDLRAALRLVAAEDAACPRKRRLAVLDYWLDNVLAGVPRLALCLEARGAVVGGKMVDTSEIPRALSATGEDALFDTASVELHAAALLRFLAKHCDRDGANYVLARDDGASPLRLYCLDSLADAKQRHWKWLLATLSARFAARIGAHLAAGGRPN